MSKKINFGATGYDTHVDVPLSNVALNYRPDGMVADMVAPIVPVTKQSNRIATFDRGEIYRVEDDKRSPGKEANIIERSVSSLTYFADNYALKSQVTIEDRENADPIYAQELYNDGARYVTGKLMLGWENRLATLVGNTSNVGSSSAVSSAWSDYTNSDPLTDMLTGIDNVYDSNGMRPNRILFGEKAWRWARRNTTIRNLIFGTNNGGGYASISNLADLLEVESINVSRTYKNTANESQAESLSQVLDDKVLVYYAPTTPSRDTPSFMYSFRWSLPGIPNMQAERHAFDTKTKAEEVEVGYYQDEKIVGASYGFLITAVGSST